jgi:hypothetical protein
MSISSAAVMHVLSKERGTNRSRRRRVTCVHFREGEMFSISLDEDEMNTHPADQHIRWQADFLFVFVPGIRTGDDITLTDLQMKRGDA